MKTYKNISAALVTLVLLLTVAYGIVWIFSLFPEWVTDIFHLGIIAFIAYSIYTTFSKGESEE